MREFQFFESIIEKIILNHLLSFLIETSPKVTKFQEEIIQAKAIVNRWSSKLYKTPPKTIKFHLKINILK
jgi:hypothetical protein